MEKDEAAAPSKSDKADSPVQEQSAIHPYPDWAAMQAYYGPGVPMPSPYFSTTTGHVPHSYMWGPQPMISPYGTPYSAIYPHGAYPYPSVALMTSPSTTDVPSVPSPSTTDVPSVPLSNTNNHLKKKRKGFNGLAVATGNGNNENTVGNGSVKSQSGENGAEVSSDGSYENSDSGGKETQKKNSDATPVSGNNKAGTLTNAAHIGKAHESSNMSVAVIMPPSTMADKPTVPATSPAPGMEFGASITNQLKAGEHPKTWMKDDRQSKREKRKQSNRESARRSRLRKQAETEELAMKVEALSAENTVLRSEIGQIRENSEKLQAENLALMEKLKNVQAKSSDKFECQEEPPLVVENFLSRIDKLREDEACENSSNGKLHQLMVSSPRTDAVAAG